MSKSRFLLPYLPDQAWLKTFVEAEAPVLDLHAHFVKQTPRNRTYIIGPNGVQALVVTIQGRNKRQAFGEVKISYRENWVRQHVNAIRTAYGSAPYFEYLFPTFEAILESRPTHLFELNKQVLDSLFKSLKKKPHYTLSSGFELGDGELDFRTSFLERERNTPAYPQVFQEKFGFEAGLSALDRMMNDLAGLRQEFA